MLCPNDKIPFEAVEYPIYASTKMDGIYCMIKDGLLYSRKLKPIRNIHVIRYLKKVADAANRQGLILYGELWGPKLTFTEIMSCVMSYSNPMPDGLCFWGFDSQTYGEYNDHMPKLTFSQRLLNLRNFANEQYFEIQVIPQIPVDSAEEATKIYTNRIGQGHEGIILKSGTSYYKHGRATIREKSCFKFKHTETFDAMVIDILPAKEMKDGVERTRTNDGYLEQVHTSDSFSESDRAGCIVIKIISGGETQSFKAGFGRGFNDERKRILLRDKDNFIGRTVEVEAMPTVKNSPRMPKVLRFRDDLDE